MAIFQQLRAGWSAWRNSRPIAVPLLLFDVPVLHKTFDRSKLDMDLEAGVRDLYQSAGYFKVVVKDPILTTIDVNREGLGPLPLIGRQRGKATNITIPIEEGEQYHMGRLVIRSADPEKGLSLKREYLETIFPLHQGDIFDISKIRKAIENYNKLYGVYGYIDFTAVPLPERSIEIASPLWDGSGVQRARLTVREAIEQRNLRHNSRHSEFLVQ